MERLLEYTVIVITGQRKKQGVCTPHSVKYFEIEEIVLKELRRMCKKYINTNMLENALKNSDKLKNKKNKILYEINKLDNEIENLKRKIDVCYNDKLDGNITLEMYKRTYNNFTLDIKNKEKEIKLYKEQLKNLENTNVTDDKYYAQKIEEFLKLEKNY